MYGLFDLGVDRAGGVVQDQDARVVQQCPGQRDPLPLAAGESEAPLADDGRVAVGKPLYELVCLGHPGRRLDFLVRRLWAAVGDIGAHRVGEKEALLEDHPDLATQRSERHFADVAPVDHHSACGGVVKARDQKGGRGLPAAARPDDGYLFPGCDVKVEALEDRLPVGVAEMHIAEIQRPS